jgi:hypothetical protein
MWAMMEKLRIFEISVIGGPVFDTGSYRGQAHVRVQDI